MCTLDVTKCKVYVSEEQSQQFGSTEVAEHEHAKPLC